MPVRHAHRKTFMMLAKNPVYGLRQVMTRMVLGTTTKTVLAPLYGCARQTWRHIGTVTKLHRDWIFTEKQETTT